MLIVHVHVHAKPEFCGAFAKASTENALRSIQEPGVVRFEVLQQADDPSRFLLVEVYRTDKDPAKHKETDHYRKWRDAVEPMMAKPRESLKYTAILPDEPC